MKRKTGAQSRIQRPRRRFPLYDKRRQASMFSTKCETCGADVTRTPIHIDLSAGALLGSKTSAGPDERMWGFLSLSYHEVVGKGDVYFRMPIVDDAPDGQFDLGFCSVLCLRQFFGRVLDKFEDHVERARSDCGTH
jgi:hypothetical protein